MSNETTSEYSMLSVIVPVYNERSTVGELIRRLRNVALPESLDLEVLVVDDGSTDGTDKVLATIEDSTVRVLKNKTNEGKGAAVRRGLAEARGQIVLIQDADLEYRPEDLPRLIEPILDGRAKVVYGSRFHPERESMTLTSLLADRAVSVATCLLYNTTLTDVETGFKVFDKSVLDDISIESDHFEVEPEITAKLLRSGQRIYEVPVAYAGRRDGKKYSTKDRAAAFKTLVRYRFGG
jgi:glycosyltransferase involved in cell wall biosynthesis